MLPRPRRPLVKSLAVLAVASLMALPGCLEVLGFGGTSSPAAGGAGVASDMLSHPPGSNVKPTGKTREFTLYLHRMDRHELYPGASMSMWGFSLSDDPSTAQFPGPTLRVTEGDKVVIRFTSTIATYNHSIHWHGQHVPWDMDGVPYLSQEPARPGEEFVYTFIAKPAGTYWYHCHVDVQHHIDMGMYGALIVDPQDKSADPAYDSEYVMILDDMDRFHVEGGQTTNVSNRPPVSDPLSYEEWLRQQARDTTRNPEYQSRVGEKRSWYPDTYAPFKVTYNTFLINGVAFPYTEPIPMQEGKVLRLRMINAGNSVFAMHLHGHHVLVTHKDGILLASPYWADTVLIGPGERYDLYVRGDNPGVWEFHDHMATHTQNDNIFPGGAMTMVVYEGFEDKAMGSMHHQHGGSGTLATGTSGDYIRWYENA